MILGWQERDSISDATLTVVRNDVYARFSHEAFNKGTALGEIAGQLGVTAAGTFAAG